MSSPFTNLAWLPPAPEDFRQRCAALMKAEEGIGRAIIQLASHALNDSQLHQLARAITGLRARGTDLAPLTPFRLGVLGNGTLDLLLPALVASAARFGIALECFAADYDQVLLPATTADSALYRGRPDAVLVALDYRGLPWRLGPDGGAEAAEAEIAGALDFLARIRQGVRTHGNVPCILQTLAPPVENLFGSLDRAIPGTPRHMIDSLNRQIIASLPGSQDVLLDVAGLAETVGLAEWHAPTEWNMAKLQFAGAFVPLYADHVGRVIGALRGKSRRCLILDLDNTLWGGVIGDDGLEGILVAQGDATGEAFLSVQRLAVELRSRGVVLAVCSKNDDPVARSGFTHPEMLLKVDQIAVFQANWNDKATNIKAIAKELSLGLDAMVFLDDNPVERGLVRQILPEVAVPELPDDPALYARTLAAAGYFEAITYSAEDRARADFYQDNARRVRTAKPGGGRRRLPRLAGHDHHLPALRRHRPGTHRATDQQVEPVQPDHAALHRGRRGGGRGRLLHAADPPGRPLRRQWHDQRHHLPRRRAAHLGDRHLADELPGARARGGGDGVARDPGPGARPGDRHAIGRLPADRTQRHGQRPL